MKTLSSSGFGYESASDNNLSEDEGEEFSPVTFTASASQGRAVPGVRLPQPINSTSGSKSRADADADVLRNGGERTVQAEMGATIGGLNNSGHKVKAKEGRFSGGDTNEGEVEKTWCVLENEDSGIRARMFSDADILNGSDSVTTGRMPGKGEGSSQEGGDTKEEGMSESLYPGDGEGGGGLEEVRSGNTVCIENGEDNGSSKATCEEAVSNSSANSSNSNADSTMDVSSRSPPAGGDSSLPKSKPEDGEDTTKQEDMGDHNGEEILKVVSNHPILRPGDNLQINTIAGVMDDNPVENGNDKCETESEVRSEGANADNSGNIDEEIVIQRDRGRSVKDESHSDSQCGKEELREDRGDGCNNDASSVVSNVAEGQVSDADLKRGSNVLSSPTRYATIATDGAAPPTNDDDVSDLLKRGSDVLSSPTRYYATTEAPEVGGVVVELLDDEQAGKLAESLQLNGDRSVKTVGEASPKLVVDECK